jgi:hypothetical protein
MSFGEDEYKNDQNALQNYATNWHESQEIAH